MITATNKIRMPSVGLAFIEAIAFAAALFALGGTKALIIGFGILLLAAALVAHLATRRSIEPSHMLGRTFASRTANFAFIGVCLAIAIR